MLETVSKGFQLAKNLLKKETVLTEENIDKALKEVRISLLEADVEYSVVKDFLSKVKTKALGTAVKTQAKDKKGHVQKLGPAEHFIGICLQELEDLMGPAPEDLQLAKPLSSIMMVGLQGSGKTTTTAKLARFLRDEKKKRPLLVAADIYRPGAVHQLQVLGERLQIPVFFEENLTPPEICSRAKAYAERSGFDLVIYDTAGRLAIDETLMHELDQIKTLCKPHHIFLVLDAMIGQDAVKTAAEFNNRLEISGFILTKLDGDARGGAALSVKQVTQKPIFFLGMGEDLQSLEPFRPSGLASRILGMGDMVSLIQDFERHVDEEKAEEDIKRMMRGSFSLENFLEQLRLIKKMGSFQSLIERIPGMSEALPAGHRVDEQEFMRLEAMVLSMTLKERYFPELFVKQPTRKKRVALGSGRKVSEVEKLLERFLTMRKMMQVVGQNPSILSRLPGFKDMGKMAQIGQAYRNNGSDSLFPPGLLGGNPLGFPKGPESRSMQIRPSQKLKKQKRKAEKTARKKNKKRK